MDVLLDSVYELERSNCSSTSTIEDEYIGGCNWNNWSPVIDWDPFCNEPDDFHGLIESMMCEKIPDDIDEHEHCDIIMQEPASTTTSEGTPPRAVGQPEGDDKGLRLVHLLIAAAEALKGVNKSRDLARVILVRLKELVAPAGPAANNMERLTAHFADALRGLLDGVGTSEGPAGLRSPGPRHHHREDPQSQHGDVLAAFQLLQDMSPYIKFGHFTANQAILESVSGDRRVHIVDYDIMEGVQWASLMQAMVSKQDGPPPPHLRITAITRGGSSNGSGGRKSMGSVQETGRRLIAFAASIGQPFSFSQCRLDPGENFRPSAVKVVKGETVIANCILHPPHLPHRSTTSIASFLSGASTIGAKLITLVEEEGELRKGGDETGFVASFIDELHRYSAIWDSLEAGFPMQGRARGLVERAILGPRIAGAVSRAYRRKEEEEEELGWGDWMSKMGFGKIGISFFNHCQARLLLGLFNDGYRVEEDAPNKIVLGWKSRRLVSASIWSSPPQSPPALTATSGLTS